MKLIETKCSKCGDKIHAVNKLQDKMFCPKCLDEKQYRKYFPGEGDRAFFRRKNLKKRFQKNK